MRKNSSTRILHLFLSMALATFTAGATQATEQAEVGAGAGSVKPKRARRFGKGFSRRLRRAHAYE